MGLLDHGSNHISPSINDDDVGFNWIGLPARPPTPFHLSCSGPCTDVLAAAAVGRMKKTGDKAILYTQIHNSLLLVGDWSRIMSGRDYRHLDQSEPRTYTGLRCITELNQNR